MIFYMNDYKGKHFVLADEEDNFYGSVGFIDEHNIDLTFLVEHATMCLYYGIPMYTGSNKEFTKRCNNAFKDAKKAEELHYKRPEE